MVSNTVPTIVRLGLSGIIWVVQLLVFYAVVLLDWILTGLDGIRMDFGWIGSRSPSLLDGLDHRPEIQLDPIA